MAKGMAQAAMFLRDLDDYGRAWSNRLKVVFIGLGKAGKTSIATRLENRFGVSCPKPDERTVGVEIRDIKLGSGPVEENGSNVELDVSLWDFAGQNEYYDTHQVRGTKAIRTRTSTDVSSVLKAPNQLPLL